LYGFNALYRIYETVDNWVFLAVCSDRDWSRLTDALGDEGARLRTDPRFSDASARGQNDTALAEVFAGMFKCRTAAEWESRMVERGVACVACAPAPIEQHYLDPNSPGRQQGYVVEGSYHPLLDEIPRLRSLISFSRSETCAGPAGLLGQHTRQVLLDHGYDEQRIDTLATERAIITL
jgi:crotonobetainyl-CoA:carnitine CoA-transferase CaiB-like acyl-CoA transferase